MLPNSETVSPKVSLDPQSSSKLGDLPNKDVGNQSLSNSVVEGSIQTKEEFRKQDSSQLSLEEEKQVQSEGQLSTSSNQKNLITGKLIFKESLSHC